MLSLVCLATESIRREDRCCPCNNEWYRAGRRLIENIQTFHHQTTLPQWHDPAHPYFQAQWSACHHLSLCHGVLCCHISTGISKLVSFGMAWGILALRHCLRICLSIVGFLGSVANAELDSSSRLEPRIWQVVAASLLAREHIFDATLFASALGRLVSWQCSVGSAKTSLLSSVIIVDLHLNLTLLLHLHFVVQTADFLWCRIYSLPLQTHTLPPLELSYSSILFLSVCCTVLGIKISHGHDYTSYAALGHFEMEFQCGTRRYDTQTQCWVEGFIVRAAHFGARMLKSRPPREGGTPKRLKIWLFQEANIYKMHWNFYRRILTPWSTISTRFHSPGHPALCATMQNPIIRAKGC